MNQLRKKIEAKPSSPTYLLTEPWVGYRFHLPPEPVETDAFVTRLRAEGLDIRVRALGRDERRTIPLAFKPQFD